MSFGVCGEGEEANNEGNEGEQHGCLLKTHTQLVSGFPAYPGSRRYSGRTPATPSSAWLLFSL